MLGDRGPFLDDCVHGGSAAKGVAPGFDIIDAKANSVWAELDRFREGRLGAPSPDRDYRDT